jgi:hypothetical protein
MLFYTRIIEIFGIKQLLFLELGMYWTPPISPQVSVIVRFDFVRVVIGSELQLKCLVNFVRIPSGPPHIDYFGLCFCGKIFYGGTGELVGVYLRGEARKRRSVREKPTIRRKLGFKLIRIP